jgi:hypothetical protein
MADAGAERRREEWATRLAEQPIQPHLLIEGRRPLTKRLRDRSPGPYPLILSANEFLNRIPGKTRVILDQMGEPMVYGFSGLPLMLADAAHDDMREDVHRVFSEISGEARDRFHLTSSDPLNLVCVGNHAALWPDEEAGLTGWCTDHWLRQGLARLRQGRGYAAKLHGAMAELGPLHFHWLTDAFRHLLPRQPGPEEYRSLAARARDMMYVSGAVGSVPLIYIRKGPGRDWEPFVPATDKTGAAPRAHTTASSLIEQYVTWTNDQPDHDSVLVKVVPKDHPHAHPFDPPIVGFPLLDQAREAGISAVLLDSKRGVIDPCDPDENTPFARDAATREQHVARLNALKAMVFAV